MRNPRSFLVVILWFGPWAAAVAEDNAEFFENRIRPLLAENCQECHAASTKQKGGLTLDSREGWAKGGDNGPAIVPGKPEESLLIKAVGYLEPDLQMPPKKKLSEPQIADLKRWIAQGAHDPRQAESAKQKAAAPKKDHWAWRPLAEGAAPEVRREDWPSSAIDRFLLAKLEANDLPPAADADPRALFRRLRYDLTGLPPSVEAMEAFVAVGDYTRAVDAALASPAFGETWGQHWLDLMRYAETLGHEQDFPIPNAWRFRDYVIRAFNADLPYDQLIQEHVAGDLLKEPRIDPASKINESIQGTGFWYLGEATHSPVDIRGDECVRVANQIDVFSKAFLGLTVQCARCHDHKFDPIPTKDYYALFGYLQSTSYRQADVADPRGQRVTWKALADLKSQHEPGIRRAVAENLRERLDGFDPIQDAQWAKLLADAAGDPGHVLFPVAIFAQQPDAKKAAETVRQRWADKAAEVAKRRAEEQVIRTETQGERNYVSTKRGPTKDDVVASFAERSGGDWLTSGLAFGEGPARVGALFFEERNGRLRPRLITRPSAATDLVSSKFTGLWRTRTFEVTADTLWARYRGKAKMFVEVDSHRVCEGPLHSGQLKRDLKSGADFQWVSHDLRRYVGHRVHVEFTPDGPFALTDVVFRDRQPTEDFSTEETILHPPPANAAEMWARIKDRWQGVVQRFARGEELSAAEAKLLDTLLAEPDWLGEPSTDPVIEDFAKQRRVLQGQLPAPVFALTAMDGSGENEPVHVRGNPKTPSKESVPRGFLAVLGGEALGRDAAGSGRAELAKHMVGESQALVSRVMVNRVWRHLMGRGLVETVDNFGATGAKPSHPELLDFLAKEFIAHDWSVKWLIREIAHSHAYRMSSQPDAAVAGRDPTNALWHRMPIRRLPAEAIRDAVLAVSGRLDRRQFGPSVAAHIPEAMRTNRSPDHSGPSDGAGRRSIYLEGRRNHQDAFLLAFDKPTPFTTIGARNVSNSPAQPLMLLNSPFMHDQAKLWSAKLLRTADCDLERIDLAYRAAFGRPPSAEEERMATQFLADQQTQEGRSPEEAWSDLAHTLMNVKEFLFLH